MTICELTKTSIRVMPSINSCVRGCDGIRLEVRVSLMQHDTRQNVLLFGLFVAKLGHGFDEHLVVQLFGV